MNPISFLFSFCLFSFFLPQIMVGQTHNWENTNPGGGGAFSTIGAGPTGTVLAGSDLSGAYLSNDGGSSWTVIGANQGLTNTHVSGIGFHPTNGNIFFIGTEDGIYRSTDGATVTKTNMPDGYVTDIEFCRDFPDRGYATYHPLYDTTLGVVYMTNDNGILWTKVSNSTLPNDLRLLKLEVHPTNKDIVYALSGDGRFNCGPPSVFRSTNGGIDWSNIVPPVDGITIDVLDFAINKENPSTVYFTSMNADCANEYYWSNMNGSFYVSTNGGDSWTAKANHSGVIWPKVGASGTVRLIDPREPYPWINEDHTGTWKTTDDGGTWTHTIVDGWDTGYQNFGTTGSNLFHSYSVSFNGIAKTLGADLSQDKIYWTNNQWVFSSDDEGAHFTNQYTTPVGNDWKSRGFDNVTMTDLSVCAANPAVAYLGYHDIGLWATTDGGNSWHSCNEPTNEELTGAWEGYGGNTFTVLVDPAVSSKVWASMQPSWGEFSYLMRNTSSGDKNQWSKTTGLIVNLDTPTVILGLSLDPSSTPNARTLFVTSDGDVFRSTDDGQSWLKVFADGGLRFTAVHPTNGNIVYAGGESGLVKSTDGGTTWTTAGTTAMQGNTQNIFAAKDWSGVSKIRINNQGDVFVSVYGDGKGLWISTNNGITWTKKITDDFMRSVAIVPNNPSLIYTASSSAFTAGGFDPSSRGVQYSTDNGNSWQPANDGMAYPFAVCMEVVSNPNPTIWVGSPGTGFQKSIIPQQILPVTMLSPFTATVRNNAVVLRWKTSAEIHNEGYQIERSTDGQTWSKLQFVFPNNRQTYTLLDKNPFEGISYYRLTQKDMDGTKHPIGIVSIQINKLHTPTVHPNPSTGIFNITFAQDENLSTMLYLYDNTGRLLLSQKGHQLNIEHLPKGTYQLTIQNQAQQWHERIIKW